MLVSARGWRGRERKGTEKEKEQDRVPQIITGNPGISFRRVLLVEQDGVGQGKSSHDIHHGWKTKLPKLHPSNRIWAYLGTTRNSQKKWQKPYGQKILAIWFSRQVNHPAIGVSPWLWKPPTSQKKSWPQLPSGEHPASPSWTKVSAASPSAKQTFPAPWLEISGKSCWMFGAGVGFWRHKPKAWPWSLKIQLVCYPNLVAIQHA